MNKEEIMNKIVKALGADRWEEKECFGFKTLYVKKGIETLKSFRTIYEAEYYLSTLNIEEESKEEIETKNTTEENINTEIENNEEYRNNGDIKKALQEAIKYLDEYRIDVQIMSTYDWDYDDNNNRIGKTVTTLDISVNDGLDGFNYTFNTWSKSIENIENDDCETETIHEKLLKPYQNKLVKYLEKHFENVNSLKPDRC